MKQMPQWELNLRKIIVRMQHRYRRRQEPFPTKARYCPKKRRARYLESK